MNAPAELLWRANNEYRKRLTQAATCLYLLEQQVLALDKANQARTLAALRHTLEEVDALAEEHRAWRYRYYYESPDTRRMVHDSAAVYQALARFSRLRVQHGRRLADLRALLSRVQRPDPAVTRVAAGGDLWTLAEYALRDLDRFDDFLREQPEAR